MSSPFQRFSRPARGRYQYRSSSGYRGRGDYTVSVRQPMPIRNTLIEKEGDTISPDGYPRRIFVKNFPSHTTIKDLKLFFGIDKIEGIALYTKYAVIQFKRPSDSTEALDKNADKFFDKILVVRRYDDLHARIRQPSSLNISSDVVDLDIERSRRIRESALSPTRSRSNSDVSSIGDNCNEIQEQTNTPNAIAVPSSSSNDINHETTEPTTSEQTLPPDIESSLHKVINEKSAKMLSLDQIERIMKFFRIERSYVMGEEPEEDIDEEPLNEETLNMIVNPWCD